MASNTSSTRPGSAPAPSPSALLDVEGVEARFGISVRMARRLVAERRIPFVKVGRHVRFRPEHIEAWLEANTIPAVVGTRSR